MFISFDGGDGCGKSTQQARLAEWIRAAGHDVMLCRDPGSTPLGEAVRKILLYRDEMHISTRSEMLLFMAARAQLVEDVIRPALASGKVVISDRFLPSNVVYQGHAGGIAIDSIERVGMVAVDGIMPNVSIILDIPYEVAMERLGHRSEPDSMEKKGEKYHRAVRDGFLQYAKNHADRCIVIDASPAPNIVEQSIREVIERLICGN
ncbi:MAG: dTMP kinase [Thermoguttaceae bacterium]